MSYDLTNQRVLITAASSGIGRATAAEFQNAGANVAICARNEAKLTETQMQLSNLNQQPVLAKVTDLTRLADIHQLVDFVEAAFGGIDVLVNNSGGPPPGSHDQIEDEKWSEAFKTTLHSSIRITNKVLPGMKKQGSGRIINLSSYSVKQPMNSMILSNSIRLAGLGWSKSLSNEVARFNILVNTICTGWTKTNRVEELLENRATEHGGTKADIEKAITSSIPVGRMASPEEIASVVLFLASPAASYITGSAIPVDGGCAQTI